LCDAPKERMRMQPYITGNRVSDTVGQNDFWIKSGYFGIYEAKPELT